MCYLIASVKSAGCVYFHFIVCFLLFFYVSVSRVHGVIVVNDLRDAYFIDLGSSNGSIVDNVAAVAFICVPVIPLVTNIKLGGSKHIYRFDVEYKETNATLTNTTKSTSADTSKNIIDKILDEDYSRNKERENDDMNTVFVSQISPGGHVCTNLSIYVISLICMSVRHHLTSSAVTFVVVTYAYRYVGG